MPPSLRVERVDEAATATTATCHILDSEVALGVVEHICRGRYICLIQFVEIGQSLGLLEREFLRLCTRIIRSHYRFGHFLHRNINLKIIQIHELTNFGQLVHASSLPRPFKREILLLLLKDFEPFSLEMNVILETPVYIKVLLVVVDLVR